MNLSKCGVRGVKLSLTASWLPATLCLWYLTLLVLFLLLLLALAALDVVVVVVVVVTNNCPCLSRFCHRLFSLSIHFNLCCCCSWLGLLLLLVSCSQSCLLLLMISCLAASSTDAELSSSRNVVTIVVAFSVGGTDWSATFDGSDSKRTNCCRHSCVQ